MFNPFTKRVSEYLKDEESFLEVISPEPLFTFFSEPARQGSLFDRLVIVHGTPGSGKTTLATLFQYPMLRTLLANTSFDTYKPLVQALTECGAIVDDKPALIARRLPLDDEYRDIWSLPYPTETRHRLLRSLIQVRTVLSWFRDIRTAGMNLTDVRVVSRHDSEASLAAIGGPLAESIMHRAREIEIALYDVTAALVPPAIPFLPEQILGAYHPFDVIEGIELPGGAPNRLLAILDDGHNLHPDQFTDVSTWLRRREIAIARWIMTRFDVLSVKDALEIPSTQRVGLDIPGTDMTREITEIRFQGNRGDRTKQRRAFRRLAKDMSGRYLRQMPLFARRGLDNLSNLLETQPPATPRGKLEEVHIQIERVESRLRISKARRAELWELISDYVKGAASQDVGEAVQLQMLQILMHRYAGRTQQGSLFGAVEPEPSKPLKVDSSVAEGARIQLFHLYDRPYYYGIDDLCDVGCENTEQFLQFAAKIVDSVEVRLIREARRRSLECSTQHALLRKRAEEIIEGWNFPQHTLVRRLADWIGKVCQARTLEPNAPLGPGANAVGVLQQDFEKIPDEHKNLASVLKFGLAYNAYSIVPDYEVKYQRWCLIELGGAPLLRWGLTLHRGGFVEVTLSDLINALSGELGDDARAI